MAQKRQRSNSATEEPEEDMRIHYPRRQANGKYGKKDAADENFHEVLKSPFKAVYQGADDMKLTIVVRPAAKWKELTKYKKALYMGETYHVDQFVYINGGDVDSNAANMDKEFWLAKILEIAASDRLHVYAKVVWLYWPRQLIRAYDPVSHTVASGRRYYHGENELIASNHIDIIEFNSIAGPAEVSHWQERDEEGLQDGLYWRQTLAATSSKLSEIRRHCVCSMPYNPDGVMYECTNMSAHNCTEVPGKQHIDRWLHEKCIINAALEKIYNDRTSDTEGASIVSNTKTSGKAKLPKKKGRKSSLSFDEDAQPWDGMFSAKITEDKYGRAVIEIVDLREDVSFTKGSPREWSEDLTCIKCGADIA